MRVYCAPRDAWDAPKGAELRVTLFGAANTKKGGSIGQLLLPAIAKMKLGPAQRAWDLLSIALSVVAADHGCLRSRSSDGWTRQIELSVAVTEPSFWSNHASELESTLGFLTGD